MAATTASGREARHPQKNHQQQGHRGSVQQDVRQVMDCGAVPQKVPHQDMRDARQRAPVFQLALGKYRQVGRRVNSPVTSRYLHHPRDRQG